ncbi:hypothetical protein Tcan_15719 [Toxocara canis]|uniref:Uncharacterized protein n=1 Tax=Toxocara canis TaxID=6265 RepID=A0A0B2VM17_TOXCA|nr:hypothetical protein Tcan_15719 [Toxocara canis]
MPVHHYSCAWSPYMFIDDHRRHTPQLLRSRLAEVNVDTSAEVEQRPTEQVLSPVSSKYIQCCEDSDRFGGNGYEVSELFSGSFNDECNGFVRNDIYLAVGGEY